MSRRRTVVAELVESPGTAVAVRDRTAAYAEVIASWNAGRSEHTVRARESDLRAFAAAAGCADDSPTGVLAFLVDLGPTLARTHTLRWIEQMRDAGMAKTTQARRVTTLRSLVAECHLEYGLPWTLRAKPPKFEKQGLARGPAPDVVEKAIAQLRSAGDWRSLAIVLLLYDVGLRRSEVVGLRQCDVVPNREERGRHEIFVVRKGDKVRWRTISKRCLDAIVRCLKERDRSLPSRSRAFVFVGREGGRPSERISSDVVYETAKDAGLGNPHGLRHTGATLIARETGDAFAVKEFLGHADIATGQSYVDRSEDLAGEMTRMIAGEGKATKSNGRKKRNATRRR